MMLVVVVMVMIDVGDDSIGDGDDYDEDAHCDDDGGGDHNTVQPVFSDRSREMSKVVSWRGGLLRKVLGHSEFMTKQIFSSILCALSNWQGG